MNRKTSLEMRKRPKQTRSIETVNVILEASAQVFSNHGYEGTTTDMIAEKAGISIGSFYQYYPNKDAVLISLLERHLERVKKLMALIQEELENEEQALEITLKKCIGALVRHHLQDADLDKILSEQVQYPDPIVSTISGIHESMVIGITHYLESHPAIKKQHPALSAGLIMRAIDTLTHHYVSDDLRTYSQEAFIRELSDMIYAYLILERPRRF